MATRSSHEEANVGTRSEGVTEAVPDDDRRWMGPRLTSEQVWRALAKASFAILGLCHPVGRATIQRRRLQDRRPTSVRRGRTRQLEGEAHRGQRAGLGDGAGAPGRDPVARFAHPARNRQLPRDGGRAPGRVAGGSLAPRGAGGPAAGGEAGLRLHHRGRPRGRVRDVRAWRLIDEDARSRRRSCTRAGVATREDTMTMPSLTDRCSCGSKG